MITSILALATCVPIHWKCQDISNKRSASMTKRAQDFNPLSYWLPYPNYPPSRHVTDLVFGGNCFRANQTFQLAPKSNPNSNCKYTNPNLSFNPKPKTLTLTPYP